MAEKEMAKKHTVTAAVTNDNAGPSTVEALKEVQAKFHAVLELQHRVARQLQECSDVSVKHQDLDRLYGEAVETVCSEAKAVVREAHALNSRLTKLQTRATRLRLIMQKRALEEEHRREAEVERDKQLLPEVVAAQGAKPQQLKSSGGKRVSSSKSKKSKPRVVELEE